MLTDERDDLVTVTFDQRTQRRRAQSHVHTLPADRAPRGACDAVAAHPHRVENDFSAVLAAKRDNAYSATADAVTD